MEANTLYEPALCLLKTMTGNASAGFHQHQYEAIEALVAQQKKMLVVQRTGWGKSAVYFIATSLLRGMGRGPSIIISPLIALMRNQISSAENLGLSVVTINSSLSQAERQRNEQLVIAQQADAIIISPEQLANQNLIENVLSYVLSNICLFVVDEAHCISDWGHDFRPDYRRITRILQSIPGNLPILATTATANDRVISDIQAQLGDEMVTLRGSLMRESLSLQTVPQWPKAKRLAWLSEIIPQLNGTGIIYAKTLRDCDTVAAWLSDNGINAASYHGDIAGPERERLEQALITNQLKVLVATSALGMGFDKPDIGFVIHYQAPGNVIEYYQQVGRAGRGIDAAVGVLMLGEEDANIQSFFIRSAFPAEEQVEQLLGVLADHDGIKKAGIERYCNLSSGDIEKVLKFLAVEDPSPIYKEGSTYSRTPIRYALPHDRIERLSSIKEGEWQQLLDYHQSTSCLMRYLANALDDRLSEDCGKCQNCFPEGNLNQSVPREQVLAANDFLRHQYVPINPRKRFGASGEAARAAFGIYQFPYQSARLEAEPGLALSRWRDGAWGDLVADGKHANGFSDELISPMIKMIRAIPFKTVPTWLCYVPSLRHPTLVSDFAHKLAQALGIHCADTVTMTEMRPPQKTRENSFRRSENLDGLFAIDKSQVYTGGVLLLDDTVDSGWTFTVVSALLKQQGAEKVYPVALTSTARG
ncbi:MAG: RecQ family ATP-dependent DNA helicase [Gammaproteobacteria bacterium]|nr:MAG: RecQ family ATP-dependent DNA helicase [Gammaproteobacteria bacterium]